MVLSNISLASEHTPSIIDCLLNWHNNNDQVFVIFNFNTGIAFSYNDVNVAQSRESWQEKQALLERSRDKWIANFSIRNKEIFSIHCFMKIMSTLQTVCILTDLAPKYVLAKMKHLLNWTEFQAMIMLTKAGTQRAQSFWFQCAVFFVPPCVRLCHTFECCVLPNCFLHKHLNFNQKVVN